MLVQGWQELPSPDRDEFIYAGHSGHYYDPDVYIRAGQTRLGFLVDATILEMRVSFDNGPWQTIAEGGGGMSSPIYVDAPWSSPGVYNMRMKWADVGATWHDHEYVVYVVASALSMYKDSYDNTMTLWESGNGVIDNPIVVVEGIDPSSNEIVAYYNGNNPPELVYQRGASLFDELRSEGYDVFIYNYEDGGIDMAENAGYVGNAVRYVEAITVGSNKIMLAGISMGGVVCRYALAEAEQLGDPLYVSHFVSLDAPQIDAVMDSEFQDYVDAQDGGDPDDALGSMAAMQLLRYSTYDPNGYYHDQFYNTLNNLNGDGYPHQTKNIGVAFSSNITNPNGGEWLELETTFGDEHFWLDPGDPWDEPGSWLPVASTKAWDGFYILAFFPVYGELVRKTHPTFIPYKSALDLDASGNSKFDVTIDANYPGFHDRIPWEIMNPLLIELGINGYVPPPPLYTDGLRGPGCVPQGESATWFTNAYDGVPPYSYQWEYWIMCDGSLKEGDMGTYDLPGSCGTWHYGSAMHEFTYSPNSLEDLKIRVTVTDDAQNTVTETALVNVVPDGPDACDQGSSMSFETAPENQPISFGGNRIATQLHATSRGVPTSFKLQQNHPNPFNSTTAIQFALPRSSNVELRVYNVLGQEVTKLVDESMESGYHQITWEAGDLPPGVYYYRLRAGEYMGTKRMLLME